MVCSESLGRVLHINGVRCIKTINLQRTSFRSVIIFLFLHLSSFEGFEFLSLGHLPNGGLVWSRLSITLDTRVAGGPQQRW